MSKKNIDWSVVKRPESEGQGIPVRTIPKDFLPASTPPKDNDSTKKDK